MIATYEEAAFHRAKGIQCFDTGIAGYQISPIIIPEHKALQLERDNLT
jgi:hypothetical protein